MLNVFIQVANKIGTMRSSATSAPTKATRRRVKKDGVSLLK
jgi:hypothetical protein